mgnify:CR=1 FL=1|jgi:hypothetical protein
MFLKNIILLSISLLLVNGVFLLLISNPSYVPTIIAYQSLQNVQLYENCFNGIDDDNDGLIDQMDEFEC